MPMTNLSLIYFRTRDGCAPQFGAAWPQHVSIVPADARCPAATHRVVQAWSYHSPGRSEGPWPRIAALLMQLHACSQVEAVWYFGETDLIPEPCLPERVLDYSACYMASGACERPVWAGFEAGIVPGASGEGLEFHTGPANEDEALRRWQESVRRIADIEAATLASLHGMACDAADDQPSLSVLDPELFLQVKLIDCITANERLLRRQLYRQPTCEEIAASAALPLERIRELRCPGRGQSSCFHSHPGMRLCGAMIE